MTIIVFFLEDGENKEIFEIQLDDILQFEDVESYKNRLTILIKNKPIDLPRLIDFLNQGKNTFQLFRERIPDEIKHFEFEKNLFIYNVNSIPRIEIDEKYDGRDEFELKKPITHSNYKILDEYRYLNLETDNESGPIHGRVIKYRDDPNDYVLDTLNNQSYYELDEDNNLEIQEWYKNGLLHRENGPAKIVMNWNNEIKTEEWFLNGESVKELPKILKNIYFVFPKAPGDGLSYIYSRCESWSIQRKDRDGKWLPMLIGYDKKNPILKYWNTDQVGDGEFNVIGYYSNGDVYAQGRGILNEDYHLDYDDNSENPCSIFYYHPEFKEDEIGTPMSKRYKEDDVEVVINYFKYSPCLMLGLLELCKIKKVLEPEVYERNFKFYNRDCNGVVFPIQKTNSEHIRYLKNIFENGPKREGIIQSINWYLNELKDRRDGPAMIQFHETGSILIKMWFKNGLKHRNRYYPAVIRYDEEGNIIVEQYLENDELVDALEFENTDDEASDEDGEVLDRDEDGEVFVTDDEANDNEN